MNEEGTYVQVVDRQETPTTPEHAEFLNDSIVGVEGSPGITLTDEPVRKAKNKFLSGQIS